MITKKARKGSKTSSNRAPIPWENRPAGNTDVIWRYSQNPVFDRNPIKAAGRIYNSAVVTFGDGFAGVFRGDSRNGMPYLYSGFSKDGLKWKIGPNRIQFKQGAEIKFDMDYAYDPRVCLLEGKYYVTWCNGYHGPTIGLATTTDFKTFTQHENAFVPFNRNGVLFPRKIKGKYYMLSRPSDAGHTPFGDIFISESPDLVHWGKHRWVMGSGNKWWQGKKIGAGPTPIETKEGWLMFYHAVMDTCNGFVYSVGVALLDLDQPWIVKYRSNQYLLGPEKDYETNGTVPNVVFPCTTLLNKRTGQIAMYYGAADTYTALAFCQLDEVMDFLKKNSSV